MAFGTVAVPLGGPYAQYTVQVVEDPPLTKTFELDRVMKSPDLKDLEGSLNRGLAILAELIPSDDLPIERPWTTANVSGRLAAALTAACETAWVEDGGSDDPLPIGLPEPS